MTDFEDQRWRQAAIMLGLDLVDAAGKRVKPARATRSHSMRGLVNGRRIRVQYGTQGRRNGITAIESPLDRSLLLGLGVQVSAPARTSTGVQLPGGLQSIVTGIDRERVRRMLQQTEPGRELRQRLQALGALGWAELRDTAVRAQTEIYTDHAESYVQVIQSVARIGVLAEAAREALEPAKWEVVLQENLEASAVEFQLDYDRRGFSVGGRVRAVPVSVALKASDRYSLSCKVAFPVALRKGSRIRRRTGLWSRLGALIGIDKATDHAAFNTAFEVTGETLDKLSREVAEGIVALSHDGDIGVDESAITYQTARLDTNTSSLLRQLVLLVELLGTRVATSPYRECAP